jgi:hypothetical protein
MKKYQVKHYNKSLVFQRTISPAIIKNDITFTSQINGGQWQMRLFLDLPIDNTWFTQSDYIEVTYFSDDFPTWKVIYYWFIDEIHRTWTDFEEIQIICYWLASLLNKFLFEDSVQWKSWPLNDDPWNIAEDVIDHANTKYNVFTKGWMTTLWSSIQYQLANFKSFKVMEDMKDLSANFYWYIWADWDVDFKVRPSTATHVFTYRKDIFNLNIQDDALWLFNNAKVQWSSWNVNYSDATSQSTYWFREEFFNRSSDLLDSTSATNFATNQVNDNKDPKRKIVLSVNNLFITENINPGDSCKIRNLSVDLWSNLLIVKVVYTPEFVNLFLERQENFIKLIKE